LDAAASPGGDADLEHLNFSGFAVPPCRSCGGILKPDVVFFAENVPRDQVAAAQASIEQADAMLIVGSSLMFYSAFASRRWRRAAASRSQQDPCR
jgi:NAD-dependent SIR2 family protein deacetylase